MGSVIPDASQPWVNLEINGLMYRYTIDKNTEDDAKVHVRNEDAINGGYIFEETDDWSQQPGGNIQRYFRFPYSNSQNWGDGEIALEGKGTISNANVTYNYKMVVDEDLMKCVMTPLADPACPGYADALSNYLNNLETPSIDDPFYDEWVQSQLDQEVDLDEEEPDVEEKDDEKEDLEKELGSKNSIEAMVDAKQQESLLAELANVEKIDQYYQVQIQGGEYIDTFVLQDAQINDNRRALRNLANDTNHKSMVRSQYDREQEN